MATVSFRGLTRVPSVASPATLARGEEDDDEEEEAKTECAATSRANRMLRRRSLAS
jgi:hypothetical protein